MGEIWNCTRESVKSALDELETARSNAQIDDAIAQGATGVRGLLKRPSIAPILATRYFDYPARTSRPPSWRLWFDQHPLLEATQVTVSSGATVLSPAQYFLEPANDGPPYTSIEINLGGSGTFSSGATYQRAVAITGLWGLGNERKQVGSLSGTLAGTVGATASLAWTTARFGVGDLLFVDSEAMVITERTFVDSGQNIGADLAAEESANAVSVSDGTGYALDEIILIGTERMRIVDIAGNVLTVRRAWDGTVLAAHTLGADVYALTGVELSRAEAGTTIAAHAGGAAVYQWRPPAMLATLNRAYALNVLLQERSGWARTLQTGGDTAIELSARGIRKLEEDAMRAYGTRARTRAIL